jgi:flagellar biosynthesis protein FlhG
VGSTLANFQTDQAEGLRRMLGASKPRVFTFLSSTLNSEKSAMLINLGASLHRAGSNVLVLDACDSEQSVSGLLGVPQHKTILDGAYLQRNIHEAVRQMPQGFSLATLMRESKKRGASTQLSDHERDLLNTAFASLLTRSDIALVDAELDSRDLLPAPILAEAHIVIQMSTSAESIKNAYALIKRLGAQLGRRPFGMLVTGANEKDGAQVFSNIALAASQYLGLDITSFGCVPPDDSLTQAVKLRRSVVEAFPMSKSSAAFRRIAEQFSTAVA